MKKIFTKARLILAGKVAVFVIGGVLSNYLDVNRPFIAQYFVGAIFGIVILVWSAQSIRELVDWRSAAFIAASTLIYVVVRILPAHSLGELNSISEIVERFWSFILDGIKLAGGVLFHTFTLPIAHALLLGASLRRVLVAIPVILGAWFKVSLVWLAILLTVPESDAMTHLTYLINFTSIWQAAYLVSMFAFRKRAQREGEEVQGANNEQQEKAGEAK
jgi:hypothetical protein